MFGKTWKLSPKSFRILFFVSLCLSSLAQASFIESTIGAAVVNDATATYYNPAALTLLKNPQVIGLNSMGNFNSQFTGTATQTRIRFRQSGTSETKRNYFLPSGYLGSPINQKLFLGFSVIGNDFNSDLDQASILRYVQSNNRIQAVDYVPGVGFKVNDVLSLGAALNFSEAHFLLRPTTGLPFLNIPDIQSRNDSNGEAMGGDLGVLLKPSNTTLVGFNYRTAMTYHMRGTSSLLGNPGITSGRYGFDFWAPTRCVFSVSQSVNKALAVISTVQWIQWDIFNTMRIRGIATQLDTQAVVIPSAEVPYHLHNSWIYTIGTNYRLTSKLVIRTAASYLESPGNPQFQITEGDSIIIGASMGYDLTKNISLDGSYAHSFIQNQTINIAQRFAIRGVNKGARNSISLKLTVNL